MAEGLDALGFKEGPHMRRKSEQLVNDFYMDDKHPDRRLLVASRNGFRMMVIRFAKEVGPRFWGETRRSHLTPTAPTWPDGPRIIETIILAFQEIARRERDKRVAERKKQSRI
ncbi:MAG: hypothetical protein M1830_009267 [Pleopsidium flavum]|nr:MAG: hypothetical protein M1830_009267 [Pleopsidium flavum]